MALTSAEMSKRFKDKRRKMLSDMKVSAGCQDCGITNPAVLDWHHVNGKGKYGKHPSRMVSDNAAWHKIMDEVSRCEVVCANCHRIRHWKYD